MSPAPHNCCSAAVTMKSSTSAPRGYIRTKQNSATAEIAAENSGFPGFKRRKSHKLMCKSGDETLSLINHQPSLDGLKIIWEYALRAAYDHVVANKIALQQVFSMNLVINAAEAMRRAAPERRIPSERKRGRDHKLPTMAGYLDEHVQRIFDPFFTNTKTSGEIQGLVFRLLFGISKEHGWRYLGWTAQNANTPLSIIKLPLHYENKQGFT